MNRREAHFCVRCGSRQIDQAPVYAASRPPFGTGMLPPQTLLHMRYLVVALIAQGGQAAVYKVNDTRLSSKGWALKEMSDSAIPASERQQAVEAFQKEAEMLARLDHPNLPKVVDVFEEKGKQYMVMEYVPGQTLLQILEAASSPLELDCVLDWAAQLCDVLSYLHGQVPPIIYRDLKPQNVMQVDGSQDIKLIDFGIARFFKAGKIKDTVLLGTPGFAPPEQYGKGQTDARADVYALGATLHFLLTRRDPATDLFKFPSVRSLNSSVPKQVDEAIARAVRTKVEERFASVDELCQALLGDAKHRAVRSKATASRPASSQPVSAGFYPSQPPPLLSSLTLPSAPMISNPGPLYTPLLTPLAPDGSIPLTLSEPAIDLIVSKGGSASERFQVHGDLALTGKVFTQDSWISVTPSTVKAGGQDVEVTVHGESLDLAASGHGWRVPNWLGRLWQPVVDGLHDGLAGVLRLLLLSPLLLAGLLLAALGELLLGLVYLHASRLVPGPRDYVGKVQVETSSGDAVIKVRTVVQPRRSDLAAGWCKVAGAVLLELGLVAAVVTCILAATI